MPNWVRNNVRIKGPDKDVVAEVMGENFDFNAIKPMPKSLDIESGSITDEAIVYFMTTRLEILPPDPRFNPYTFTLIANPYMGAYWFSELVKRLQSCEWSKEKSDKYFEMGRQYVFNYSEYGCKTWYEWCNREWGTKWNACETQFWETVETVNWNFETAWCTPVPIFEEIVKKYDVSIVVDVSYEDIYEGDETYEFRRDAYRRVEWRLL